MTAPSKTDAELRLAIAEELGWTEVYDVDSVGVGLSVKVLTGKMPNTEGKKGHRCCIPNYPGDIAAAMGLLISEDDRELPEHTFRQQAIYEISELDVIVANNRVCHDNTLKGIARALCEAWLQARRNDV